MQLKKDNREQKNGNMNIPAWVILIEGIRVIEAGGRSSAADGLPSVTEEEAMASQSSGEKRSFEG